MITPEQQQQIQDRLKGTAPASPANAGGSNWYASLKQQNTPAPTPAPTDSPVMSAIKGMQVLPGMSYNNAKTGYEAAKGVVGGIKDTFTHHAEVMDNPNTSTADRIGQQGATAFDLGAQVVDAPFKVGGAVLAANTPDWLKNAGASAVGSATDEIKSVPGAMEAWTKIHELAAQHPAITQALKGIATAASDVFMGGTGKVGAKVAEETVLPALEKGVGAVSDTVTGAKDAVTGLAKGSAETDGSLLKDLISPKPTAKEARLALDQGRLYNGTKGTLLSEGTPGKIAASDQQMKSVQTIQRLIPDAAELAAKGDGGALYSEMNNQITDISRMLKPELEKTALSPQTVEQINTGWKDIKKAQLAEAPATEEANVLKRQIKFEQFLQKSGSGTMNDIWETAKAYDASIPDRVKQANEMATEALQLQKDEWLQNRTILREAIHDSQNGLGETSRQAFSDMRDLYEAQNGMLSKAKLETKADPSTISKWMKEHPTATKIGGTAATAAIGIPAIESLLGH